MALRSVNNTPQVSHLMQSIHLRAKPVGRQLKLKYTHLSLMMCEIHIITINSFISRVIHSPVSYLVTRTTAYGECSLFSLSTATANPD